MLLAYAVSWIMLCLLSSCRMMMMKFMFNVAAISWMMSDSRMGLVLVYNALGLMSNNVSLHVYTINQSINQNTFL